MKLHLPLRLLASLLVALGVASTSAFADASYTHTSADMGNIMCVGDSITHGVSSASYRWPLFKILVDNGYNFNEVGVMTGRSPGGGLPPFFLSPVFSTRSEGGFVLE